MLRYRLVPDLPRLYSKASGNELLTTSARAFDPSSRSRVLLTPTEQEALMTILDPKTGQLVTIDLTSKPRRG